MKPKGYRHTTPYRSVANIVALKLLLGGPTSAQMVAKALGWVSKGGPANLRDLAKQGYARRQGKAGHHNEKFFVLTDRGRTLAEEWGLVLGSAARRGECCERAIFGIEGEHDPEPLCRRRSASAPPEGIGSATPVPVAG